MGLAFPHPPLSDGVVALRPYTDADLAWVVEACQDPEIARWTRVPSPYREEDGREFLALARSPDPDLALAIVSAADGTPLGSTGVKTSGHPEGHGEIGYWVVPGARGAGVATRAVALLAPWALRTGGLRRLEARIHRGNAPSHRVVARAGFFRDGVLRDLEPGGRARREDIVVYSLPPRDPPPAARRARD